MSGHALIALRDGQWAVKAPVKLRSGGELVRTSSILYFPTLEAARDFCWCCEYTCGLAVPPLNLEPPPGGAGAS